MKLKPQDLYSGFTYSMLQSANSIYSNRFYMDDSIFANDENLIHFGMSQGEKIKALLQRDHVRSEA